ncbi:MAG: hypothetical protein H6658_16555 [Ardenticatenaceae bacterium]|nr:hypothetical protein [Ardenticatenaceae bacterium]
MAENKKDPIPETFDTLDELAEFWDTHDLTDYEAYLTPVEMEMNDTLSHEYVIVLSDSLDNLLHKVQSREGVPLNTLINLWVQEKLLSYPLAD